MVNREIAAGPDGRYNPEEVAAAVAAVIRLQPQRWDQGAWFADNDSDGDSRVQVQQVRDALYAEDGTCGSTACVAGWAAILTAPAGTSIQDGTYLCSPDGQLMQLIERAGRRALGLNLSDAHWLFSGERDREQVLAALDSVAAGEPMTRVYDWYDW